MLSKQHDHSWCGPPVSCNLSIHPRWHFLDPTLLWEPQLHLGTSFVDFLVISSCCSGSLSVFSDCFLCRPSQACGSFQSSTGADSSSSLLWRSASPSPASTVSVEGVITSIQAKTKGVLNVVQSVGTSSWGVRSYKVDFVRCKCVEEQRCEAQLFTKKPLKNERSVRTLQDSGGKTA